LLCPVFDIRPEESDYFVWYLCHWRTH
jgi:hypothetical protein